MCLVLVSDAKLASDGSRASVLQIDQIRRGRFGQGFSPRTTLTTCRDRGRRVLVRERHSLAGDRLPGARDRHLLGDRLRPARASDQHHGHHPDGRDRRWPVRDLGQGDPSAPAARHDRFLGEQRSSRRRHGLGGTTSTSGRGWSPWRARAKCSASSTVNDLVAAWGIEFADCGPTT